MDQTFQLERRVVDEGAPVLGGTVILFLGLEAELDDKEAGYRGTQIDE